MTDEETTTTELTPAEDLTLEELEDILRQFEQEDQDSEDTGS